MKKFCFILCVLLVLSLCACSILAEPETTEPITTAPTEEITSEPTEETQREATGPALAETPDGGAVLILTDYYTLTLPHEWASTCVYTIHSPESGGCDLSIYESRAYFDFGGGKLCTLMMVPTNDDTYKDFPDYELLAALDTPEGSFYVIALFPTDVQFTEETMETYNEMSEQLMDVLYTMRPCEGIEMAMP